MTAHACVPGLRSVMRVGIDVSRGPSRGSAGPVPGVGRCAPLVAAPAGVPRVAALARAGGAYVGGVKPAQRVTLVIVLLISALLCAYVWTGWVHAEHGLAAFLAAVLVVAAGGLLAGFHAARRAG